MGELKRGFTGAHVADVSVERGRKPSESVRSGGKALLKRLALPDAELEAARANVGATGEPGEPLVYRSNCPQSAICPDCGYRMGLVVFVQVWHCARCYYAEPTELTPARVARDLRAMRQKKLAFRARLASRWCPTL